jgi:type II secretory pathway component PulM
MTTRDRLVIVGVLLAAALAGFWFLGLAPKRKESANLQAQIATQTQQLTTAQAQAATARQAKARYNDDYAAVAKLGKAVPKSDALPSLVYQLQSVAHSARIDFTSLKIAGGGGQGPTPTPAATAGGASASGTSATQGSSSSTPAAASGSSSTPATTSPAPATQAAASALPPGATVGSAGFPTMPFSFVFSGTYFDMERFFGDVQSFVKVKGKQVDADGRLLSIDGFSLVAGPGGFPNVKASVAATAYLRTAADDNTSTAPTGAAATPAGSTASGSSAGGGASPAPTASEVSQ